jgi:putative transposase
MPDYRRNRIPGATYFFTVNLREHSSDLLVAEIETLRECVREVRRRFPLHVDAWVVLPDHMHCLWTLPAADSDFPERWRRIKAGFSRALPGRRKGGRSLWQRGYWEHTIRDDRDYTAHMDYIHFNPVKHGLVSDPADWPFSTFRRCVAAGLYPPQWLGASIEPAQTGERRPDL